MTKVYDGEAHAAGTARATDTNGNDLKIEYQKANGSWTEDPTEITATEVKDSVTVNVRVSSEGNYDGYVVIRQIKRCLLRQIKTGFTEHLTMV